MEDWKKKALKLKYCNHSSVSLKNGKYYYKITYWYGPRVKETIKYFNELYYY